MELVAGFLSLWRPELLVDAEQPPEIREPENCADGPETLAVVAQSSWSALPETFRGDLEKSGAKILTFSSEQARALQFDSIRQPLALPTAEREADDFLALGYAYLGVSQIFAFMKQDNAIDQFGFQTEVRRAAEAWLRNDADETQHGLQAAFDKLLTARQTVYPATIVWLDFALYAKEATLSELKERLSRKAELNLILSGQDLDQRGDAEPEFLVALSESMNDGLVEVLGGVWDERPFSLLGIEGRTWQIEKAMEVAERRLGRELETFASRTLALAADLPQLLMKYRFRYAVHASYDGSRIPHFREPMLHWTAPDGSVAESIGRTAVNGGDLGLALSIFATLGQSLMQDRSATVAVAHWLHRAAPWYQWLLRIHSFAPVFGRFERASEFFIHAGLPDRPTRTRAEEYASNALALAQSRATPKPISRWRDYHLLRGKFASLESLATLRFLHEGSVRADLPALETALETGEAGIADRLETQLLEEAERLATTLTSDGEPGQGYLVFNPSNIVRRACVTIQGLTNVVIQPPVRGFQVHDGAGVVVVDIPAWGYTYVAIAEAAKTPARTVNMAVAKRLCNEFVDVEIDPKTGGIHNLKAANTRFDQFAQQLVHGAGGATVCDSTKILATGPAMARIVSYGRLLAPDSKKVLAQFEQHATVWLGRPVLDLEIRLKNVQSWDGAPDRQYIASTWGWPDEKSVVSAAVGNSLAANRADQLDTPTLIRITERQIVTDLAPFGLPFHRRTGPKSMETILLAPGEELGAQEHSFRFRLAVNLPNPWSLAAETMFPTVVARVERRPKGGNSRSLLEATGERIFCSRMTPVAAEPPIARFRCFETNDKTQRFELKLPRTPSCAKLTNFRNQLIFELRSEKEKVSVDFSPRELLQFDVQFS